MRLPSMWLGIVLFPLGQLIYGWSFEMQVHIAVGIVGLFFRKFVKPVNMK
jgi:hypothetical protein